MPLSSAIRATVGILLLVPFLSGCGLVLVEGPAPGWETANAEDLETMAVSQPCTNSKILPGIDLALAGANTILGAYNLLVDPVSGSRYYIREKERRKMGIASLVWASAQAWSFWKGTQKVNDCRAFNVRLFEEQRRGAQAQATYNWLDEFSPAPELGVAPQNLPAIIPPVRGFSPVFSGPISNSPKQ